MSKIGRRPIDLGNVQIEINGQEVHYKGKKDSGVHALPEGLQAELVDNKKIKILCDDKESRESKRLWGLHRALLANEIKGADQGFEKQLNITGLGYKAAVSGDKLIFSLGYSHKIEFPLPKGISVDIDKKGQTLKVSGSDKERVGAVCSEIKALRPPEPYKGTGIQLSDETILRKAGKTKSA
ncbi:MAG: 50S ribosomal protein L6 [Candidatus Babeliales bacterium]